MKIYIAAGGIGCRILNRYAEEHPEAADSCYYLDLDAQDISLYLHTNHCYAFRHRSDSGSHCYRQIGRDIVRHDIYTGELSHLFAPLEGIAEIDLVFVTTSFGGFGSAAVMELLPYLEARFSGRIRSGSVLAFTDRCFSQTLQSAPKLLADLFAANTVSMASDMLGAEQRLRLPSGPEQGLSCRFYLLEAPYLNPDTLWTTLELSHGELAALDVKDRYRVRPARSTASVFISYASENQKIADQLADGLTRRNVSCWIATRNIGPGESYPAKIMQGIRGASIFVVLISEDSIRSPHVKSELDTAFSRLKDGLMIVPVIIDGAKLDDDCQYYLGRQEFVYANSPHIASSIDRLCDQIAELID